VARFDRLDDPALASLAADLAALRARPKVSLVMPVYNTLASDLTAAVMSVRAQVYGDWELCMCDDASTQPHVWPLLQELAASDGRIKVMRRDQNGHISAATNSALAMCTGDYVAFFDHDDVLAPHALLRVVEWFEQHVGTRLVYSDEDKLGADGQRFDPYFKPDFNLGLLRSHNYMCHFAVYERSLLKELGGIRLGFEGAQDYDLALRAVDAVTPDQIGHIPHVLYHWRVTPGSTAGGHQEKSYAFLAGQRALRDHLVRRGLAGEVLEAPEAPGMYRVQWTLPDTHPLVSIVIPTRNGADLLRTCLDSLRETRYQAFEVVVVDNGSDDPVALELMAERESVGEIRVLRDPSPFNYSALNNRAVTQACRGEFVVLMNNDIEITHPEWLAEMVGMALEPGVGCVGARLWYPDGRLQHGGVIMVCGVAGHAHKYLPRGHHGYMGRAVLAQDFLAVTAACLLVRREVFNEVGGLDESLKVAFNDVDFCLRVHAAGYRNVWTPFAQMIHHESVTRGHEDTPEKQQRFAGEIAILQTRWPDLLAHDPCYSPNLTNQAEDFSFAWPPRRKMP
jgi:GT2 family glycosyltransferase